MANDHGSPDTLLELSARDFDLLPACIISTTPPTAPASGLTLLAFPTSGYVRRGAALVYVTQPAQAVTLPNTNGTYWLVLTTDTHTVLPGYTRVVGSHYAYIQSATQPVTPDGGQFIASAVVVTPNITTVTPVLSPPLSRQNASAVAITDGRISLGGHAPTGVLDVQGSLDAGGGEYYGARLWPVAPSGATIVLPLRVEAATGAGLATAAFYGYFCGNQPAMGNVRALSLAISSGTGRYNVHAEGTAQNYFAGNVGIVNPTPSYPLDVSGHVRVSGGAVGLGLAPGAHGISMLYNKSGAHGLLVRPTVDVGPGAAMSFENAAAAQVGSITTTGSATAYNTSSDVRLKFGVTALTGALEVVRALRPISFRWQVDGSQGHGFLAHELMQTVPEAVSGLPDEVNADGSIKPQQVDHARLVVWLVGAVQELAARVQALETALGV